MRPTLAVAAVVAAVVLGLALVRGSRVDFDDPEPASTDAPRATSTPAAEDAGEWEAAPAPEKRGEEPSGRLATGPRRAARGFLASYLPWQYGSQRAARGLARWGTPALARRLVDAPVRVPASVAARRDRVRVRGLVAAEPFGADRRGAVALVADGRRSLTIELLVVRRGAGWRVSSVGGL